jgi:hypothetical protein
VEKSWFSSFKSYTKNGSRSKKEDKKRQKKKETMKKKKGQESADERYEGTIQKREIEQ